MIARLCTLFVLASVPVLGQSRVYTNRDLGKPIQWTAPAPTEEQLRALEANQFHSVTVYTGPQVIVAGGATGGPFGPLILTPVQPLSPPWSHTTRVRSARSSRASGSVRVPAP
jgi:hypothetical protein